MGSRSNTAGGQALTSCSAKGNRAVGGSGGGADDNNTVIHSVLSRPGSRRRRAWLRPETICLQLLVVSVLHSADRQREKTRTPTHRWLFPPPRPEASVSWLRGSPGRSNGHFGCGQDEVWGERGKCAAGAARHQTLRQRAGEDMSET